MLKDNLKDVRRSKKLSQEELAERLHVVRQTVSKWERGSSIPDARMLVKISQILEMPVETLLGEELTGVPENNLEAVAKKLEAIDVQLRRRKETVRKVLHVGLIVLSIAILATLGILYLLKISYADWNYDDLENAILGVAVHEFEWLFVRVAPVVLILAIVGIWLTRRKH